MGGLGSHLYKVSVLKLLLQSAVVRRRVSQTHRHEELNITEPNVKYDKPEVLKNLVTVSLGIIK